VNLLKQSAGSLLTIVFIGLIVLSTVSALSGASAQTNSYSVTQVDHQVQVMYSGNVVIFDTIHVSGQISNGFMIGVPYKYSAEILKVIAYDETQEYSIKRGVPLDDRNGFYGIEVNFEGVSPAVFTVAFVLSNQLVSETESGGYNVDFPAYPSLTQNVKTCNVNITFSNRPTSISINKADGVQKSSGYVRTDLPAYTYSIAQANVTLPAGTLQIASVNSLDHMITIDAKGNVAAEDTYQITNKAVAPLGAFVLSLPREATNVVVRDQTEEPLQFKLTENSDRLLVSVVFGALVNQGQKMSLTVQYSLPGAELQNADYVLRDFKVFPDFQYLVEQATAVFSFPEGATLVLPQITALDTSATLTRNTYQDILTINAEDVSYVDYLTHQQSSVGLAYNYNPVWVSLRATFWAVFGAVIGCVGIFGYRIYKSREETYENRAGRIAASSQLLEGEINPDQQQTPQQITQENIKDFIETNESKKHLTAELRSLDAKAQKGKIQRQQYKLQKKTVETHIEGITRNIDRKKALWKRAGGIYADWVIQIDLAEADMAEAEKSMENLAVLYDKGEITRENYKQSMMDHQKVYDKAEVAIKGILQRLREKIR
jgi:hypothetical protein